MIRKLLLLVILSTMLMFTACAKDDGVIDKEDLDKDIEVTAEEEEFLIQTFGDDEDDIERIEDGDLYSSEKKCIIRGRMAMEYLQEKYPDEEFKLVYYEGANVWDNPYIHFEFIEGDNEDEKYEVRLEADEDDEEYEISDTFCHHLIKDTYDEYFIELLEDGGFEDCITYTTFSYPLGEKFDADISGEDLWASKKDLGASSSIYIKGDKSQAEELAGDIKEYVLGEEWYGSYKVYVLEEMSGDVDAIREYVKENKDEVYELSFQSWND